MKAKEKAIKIIASFFWQTCPIEIKLKMIKTKLNIIKIFLYVSSTYLSSISR